MKRIYLDEPIAEQYLGAILALGNFDGFHLGHQAVVGEAVRWARSTGAPCIVATFDPHPVRYFSPGIEPFHLTTLDQRQELLEAAGADAMLIFRFNERMASVPADNWVERVVARRLAARGVVTGKDFNFGKDRGGDITLLNMLGRQLGIAVRSISAVYDQGVRVSSSRIRKAIQSGDCPTATRLLTRPYTLRGRTRSCDRSSHTLGIRTTKIELGSYMRPLPGKYVASVAFGNTRIFPGIADFPPQSATPSGHDEFTLFLRDFPGSLLGEEVDIRIVSRRMVEI